MTAPQAAGTGAARAHVFVADLDDPVLDPADLHHLRRVLRLRPGELVTAGDGAGGVRPFRFGPELVPEGDAVHVERPRPAVTVAFALTKGDRPEWVVQRLTEAGVDRMVPFVAARSVVRWDPGRAAGHLERLRRVAREAAMQSRRAWLPAVDDVRSFAAVAGEPGAALADLDGDPPSLDHPVALVGPEGGWSDEERGCGLVRVCLGDTVLRAETAALAAGVLLCAMRAAVVAPARPPRR